MEVKIDTKANFKVLTVEDPEIHANMAEELVSLLEAQSAGSPGSLILVFPQGTLLPDAVTAGLRAFGERAAGRPVSFVVTGVAAPRGHLAAGDPSLPLVRTLAEAIDLVMMETLERELMGGEEELPGD